MSITNKLIRANTRIKELEADIVHTSKVHAGDVRELQAKVDRLEKREEEIASLSNKIINVLLEGISSFDTIENLRENIKEFVETLNDETGTLAQCKDEQGGAG